MEQAITNRNLILPLTILFPIVFIVAAYYIADFSASGLSAGKKDQKTIPEVKSAETAGGKSLFASKIVPIYAKPVSLKIETRGIDLKLMEVALTDDGTLDTPKDWKLGGWYKSGARPGEGGNMIINAHYDDAGGRPAAFWGLKNVLIGDKVTVLDDLGRYHVYKVTQKFYLSIQDPDRLKIFDSENRQSEITLITCGGVWLNPQSGYSQRLVVKGLLELE